MAKDGFGSDEKLWASDMRVLYGGPPAAVRESWEKKKELARLELNLRRNGPCTVKGCAVCSGELAERYERREPK